jgi:TonB family protein
MLKKTVKVFCLLSVLGLGDLPALAQSRSSSADLTGAVTNPSRLPLRGASVTASNLATGLARGVTTDASGVYRIPLQRNWMAGATQADSFENRAISSAQKISASDLDEALPQRPFARWFNKTIGLDAGVVWQLTECGEPIGAPREPEQDLPACAEITAKLPDGRRVFVAIRVGTFKKGLAGKPSFFLAVIEENEQLYPVRRLSDLPERLRDPEGLSQTVAKNRIADVPAIIMDSGWFISPFRYLGPMFASIPPVAGDLSQAEDLSPAAPPPPTQDLVQVPESVSLSWAIIKVNPDYPPTAKEMNITETVEVETIISEVGLVIQAEAISGRLALRSAAVEAARKWVFKPAMLNGKPIRVKSVLTFAFVPST